MRPSQCPRQIVLLADGGAKVVFACGDEVVNREENAVDYEVLLDRFGHAHHHRRRGRHD